MMVVPNHTKRSMCLTCLCMKQTVDDQLLSGSTIDSMMQTMTTSSVPSNELVSTTRCFIDTSSLTS